MTIITRRHPLKFYIVLILSFLFFFAMASYTLYESFHIFKKGQPVTKEYFLPVISIAVYFLAFYMVYCYWKNSPKITIDKYNIQIGDQTFHLKDIKDVALTGKMPFRFIIRFPMEGTAILFNDGTERFLFDDMYSNSFEVKLYLDQVFVKKQEYKPALINKIRKKELRFERKETFKGNQFTSLRGISLWGILGLITFLIFSNLQSLLFVPLIFLSAIGTFWFTVHSWLMHYFGLTKDYFVVRNHNFIWMVKIYRLTDIKEIVFESQGKQPNCLRIITTDFRNKLYPAGTLRDKTWLYLKAQLESKGITVRNECIY